MNTEAAFKKDVLDSNGNLVGKLNGLEFTLPPGNISHLIVKTGPFQKKLIAVDLVNKSGDNIILSVTREELITRNLKNNITGRRNGNERK